MGIVVYHEIDPHSLRRVLKEGVRRTVHSAKSEEHLVKKTNLFLETHRDDTALRAKLSRLTNTYAYLGNHEKLIDIVNGVSSLVPQFVEKTGKTLVRMKVDPSQCYVADLDLYDTLKRAMELDEADSTREHLAVTFWEKLVRLDMFSPDLIKRPEVMVTYDVSPRSIEPVVS